MISDTLNRYKNDFEKFDILTAEKQIHTNDIINIVYSFSSDEYKYKAIEYFSINNVKMTNTIGLHIMTLFSNNDIKLKAIKQLIKCMFVNSAVLLEILNNFTKLDNYKLNLIETIVPKMKLELLNTEHVIHIIQNIAIETQKLMALRFMLLRVQKISFLEYSIIENLFKEQKNKNECKAILSIKFIYSTS